MDIDTGQIKQHSRTERHEIDLEFDVEGLPEITDRTGFKTKHPSLLPRSVNLDYRRRGDEWRVTARVYGSHPGTLLNGWADYGPSNWHAAPEWLTELSVEYQP